MFQTLTAIRLISIALAGWLTERHQALIGYLIEENRVLREQLGQRRLRFSDAQRRRLVIAVRETPLHTGHLETLAQLSRLGAV